MTDAAAAQWYRQHGNALASLREHLGRQGHMLPREESEIKQLYRGLVLLSETVRPEFKLLASVVAGYYFKRMVQLQRRQLEFRTPLGMIVYAMDMSEELACMRKVGQLVSLYGIASLVVVEN